MFNPSNLPISGPNELPRDPRVHIYDVYDNELSETLQPPVETRTVFHDFKLGLLAHSLIQSAEQAFYDLESDAEQILADLVERTYSNGNPTRMNSFFFDRQRLATLRKYLVFLRFRNSVKYHDILHSLEGPIKEGPTGAIFPAYQPEIAEHHRRIILRAIIIYLQHSPGDSLPSRSRDPDWKPMEGGLFDALQTAMYTYCWRLCDAELCIGIASEEQEFILPNACFGTLDEGFSEDP